MWNCFRKNLFDANNYAQRNADESANKLVGQNGELPYDPNQPRAPKGTPIGGQWVKAGGGSGGSGSNASGSSSEKNKESSQSLDSRETVSTKTLSALSDNLGDKQNLIDLPEKGLGDKLWDTFKDTYKDFKSFIEKIMPDKNPDTIIDNLLPKPDDGGQVVQLSDTGGNDATKDKEKFAKENSRTSIGDIGDSQNERNSVNNFEKRPIANDEVKMEIGKNGVSVWLAKDIKIEGFEPGSRHTVLIKVKYDIKDQDGNVIKTEEKVVAYDVKADKNGEVLIPRVGIVNMATERDKLPEGKLGVDIDISTVPGKAADNYTITGGDQFNETGKNDMGTYLSDHTREEDCKNKDNIPEDEKSGNVTDYDKRPHGESVFKDKIEVDVSEKGWRNWYEKKEESKNNKK